jgi:amino acid transporter
MKPHRANTVLVFGILSLLVCAPLGIAAWIMGNTDLREMDSGLMDPSGRDSTNAGRICGMIGTILMILALVFLIVMLSFIGFAGAMGYAASKEMEKQKSDIELVEPAPAPLEPAPVR